MTGLSMIVVKLRKWACMAAEHLLDFWWEVVVGGFWALCREPVYMAYIVFLAPKILRALCFLGPLILSTVLLILVVFSFGPQLERLRMEAELQWKSLLEPGDRSLKEDDAFHAKNGSDVCLLSDWKRTMDMDLSQSKLFRKMGFLLGKLVAELGSDVGFHVPDVLESIAEAFVEATKRQYEEEEEEEELPEPNFSQATNDLDQQSPVMAESANADAKSGQLYCIEAAQFPLEEPVDKPQTETQITIGVKFKETTNPQMEIRGEEGDNAVTVVTVNKADSRESTNAELSPVTDPVKKRSLYGVSMPSEIPEGSGEEPNLNLLECSDSVEVQNKKNQDTAGGGTSNLGKEETAFVSGSENLPVELQAMDRLWEEEYLGFSGSRSCRKEKDWKRTLACKFYEEQQNRWKETLAGKFHEDHPGVGLSKYVNHLSPPTATESLRYLDKKSRLSSSCTSASAAESPMSQEEEMDQLWEAYNDAQAEHNHGTAAHSRSKGLSKALAKLRNSRNSKHSFDSDADDDDDEGPPDSPQLCCLKALRFSASKVSLRRPNLIRFSKAIKNLGIIHHLQRPKVR